jgi:hypothetical protein
LWVFGGYGLFRCEIGFLPFRLLMLFELLDLSRGLAFGCCNYYYYLNAYVWFDTKAYIWFDSYIV